MRKLQANFFTRDVLDVAPDILNKYLVRRYEDGTTERHKITEVEAYRGEEDKACHVSKGKTKRNQVMYDNGGLVYVYLIYGMYWMLNFVTSVKDNPQAILIRGLEEINGPGRLTKKLQIDRSFYGEDLSLSERMWVEDNEAPSHYETKPRVGIDYAGELWKNKPWRFIVVK